MPGDINELRTFVKIVEAGSLSAAARRLDSSPAAMSRALASLEKRLNVRLIARTSRKFSPTEEGLRFHDRCLAILNDIAAAEAEASASTQAPHGLLTLAAPMGMGQKIIAPLLQEFSSLYPHIELQLMLTDAGIDIARNPYDLVLGTRLPDEGSLIAKKIFSERRIVCATPGYFARYGRPRIPQDLHAHHCLCLIRKDDIFNRWRFMQNGKLVEIKVRGRLAASSSAVIQDWVQEGQGIGLLAMWDIYDALQNGEIEECLTDYWSDTINLYAMYAEQRYLPQRIRLFLDFLTARFRNLRADHGVKQQPFA